jgi:4a-hydroxytetrahydrobiopterin dehydratase
MTTADDFTQLGLTEWQVSGDTAEASYECGSFTAGGTLVARIAAIADSQNHHPDVSLGYPGVVKVTTSSHDVGALTDRDLTLARAIHDAAAESAA